MEEYGLALLLPSGTNSPWKEKLFKIKYMCTHAKKKTIQRLFKLVQVIS